MAKSKLPWPLRGSLRKARRANGLTQGQLAANTELSLNTISRIERGDNYPSEETIARLEAVLGELGPGKVSVTDDELRWLDLWRTLSPSARTLAYGVVEHIGKNAGQHPPQAQGRHKSAS